MPCADRSQVGERVIVARDDVVDLCSLAPTLVTVDDYVASATVQGEGIVPELQPVRWKAFLPVTRRPRHLSPSSGHRCAGVTSPYLLDGSTYAAVKF